ncbi:MAG: NUDIX hydrolase [Thermaurantimonas sp.]
MNYCSICGSDSLVRKIPEGDHFERLCCENCGYIHYQNPNLIVGTLSLQEDRVLLAKRSIEPRKDLWNLPCGFLEIGETVEEGARRETLEETAAQVRLIRLHVVYNLPHARQVYMIFLAEMLSEHKEKTSESSMVQLFKKDEIPWEEIAFSSTAFALKKYFEDPGYQGVHFGTYWPKN